jgi:hypothetical protein
MSSFEDKISTKIEALETNYTTLNEKIETIQNTSVVVPGTIHVESVNEDPENMDER